MTDTLNRRSMLKALGSTSIAAVGGMGLTGTAAASPGNIPSHYLKEYKQTGCNWGLGWAYLAGIGWIESHHGTLEEGCEYGPPTEYGRAKGPMQFIDSTWEAYGIDGNNNGQADPCEYQDAIPAAAKYLKANGAPGDWYGAIYAYNHSDSYVNDVIDAANYYRDKYGSGCGDGGGGGDGRYRWPVFSRGDRSTDIYTIQYLLEKHGHNLKYHDGIYGPETESNVTAFQRATNIAVDGIVGPQTWGKLIVNVFGPNQDPWWATYAVQHNLRHDHGHSIAVDGYYGPETSAAIKRFQRSSKITVDGLVGPETWRALVAR